MYHAELCLQQMAYSRPWVKRLESGAYWRCRQTSHLLGQHVKSDHFSNLLPCVHTHLSSYSFCTCTSQHHFLSFRVICELPTSLLRCPEAKAAGEPLISFMTFDQQKEQGMRWVKLFNKEKREREQRFLSLQQLSNLLFLVLLPCEKNHKGWQVWR